MLPSANGVEPRDRLFASTRWSIVRKAGASGGNPDQALTALSQLCGIYWRPVYLFLRRHGVQPHDAEDLTQGFFHELIESRSYKRADQSRGQFRSFLLGALKHFVADTRDRACAQKRGGGARMLPLDEAAISAAEAEAVRLHCSSPERGYDREWAQTLLRQAFDRLATECVFAGKADLFDALKAHLASDAEARIPYDELALRVGRSAASLRKAAERFRARYSEILREEVRDTVLDVSDVDGELHYLCQALSST